MGELSDGSQVPHPNVLRLLALIYPTTAAGQAEATLRDHTELRMAGLNSYELFIRGITQQHIVEAIFRGTYEDELASLCQMGLLATLDAVEDVPCWRICMPELEYGLLAALSAAEQAAAQSAESTEEVARYYDDSENGNAFVWCMRRRWDPGAPWFGVHVSCSPDGRHMSADELRIFPPDYEPEPNPFDSL